MRSFQTVLAIILFVFIFFTGSCSNKQEPEHNDDKIIQQKNNASRLEGSWEIKTAEGELGEMNIGTVYEFKGNKLSFGKNGFSNPGNTIITDSTFSFQAEGSDRIFLYNYYFEGNTLVIELQNSNGQKFYLKKL